MEQPADGETWLEAGTEWNETADAAVTACLELTVFFCIWLRCLYLHQVSWSYYMFSDESQLSAASANCSQVNSVFGTQLCIKNADWLGLVASMLFSTESHGWQDKTNKSLQVVFAVSLSNTVMCTRASCFQEVWQLRSSQVSKHLFWFHNFDKSMQNCFSHLILLHIILSVYSQTTFLRVNFILSLSKNSSEYFL